MCALKKSTFLPVTILVSTSSFSPAKPASYFLNNYRSVVSDEKAEREVWQGPSAV